MKPKKIFVTGGHVTPALAVISEVRKIVPNWNIVFLGRLHAMEQDSEYSEEYRLVHEAGITFLPLTTGRIQRFITPLLLVSLLKIPIGLLQSFWYSMREKPDGILSFGGYMAVPVCLCGWALRIPIITHEQTRVLGLANRIISRISTFVCVSYPDMVTPGREDKYIYTGLPLRNELFSPPPKPSFRSDTNLPLLYITGGSTGSTSLNSLVYDALSLLTREFFVVHQVGAQSYAQAVSVQRKLPESVRKNYVPLRYLEVSDLAWVYAHADITVGRSGANTVAELLALGVPSLCIPLPWAGGDEQRKNARYLEESGLGRTLEQEKITGNVLVSEIRRMHADRGRFGKGTLRKHNASGEILSVMQKAMACNT